MHNLSFLDPYFGPSGKKKNSFTLYWHAVKRRTNKARAVGTTEIPLVCCKKVFDVSQRVSGLFSKTMERLYL